MGEFSPPFFWAAFFLFCSYPSNIEIIFNFSDIITKINPHFKILDPPLPVYRKNPRSIICETARSRSQIDLMPDSQKYSQNRPRSIYQYSNMTPRLSGQTSIFGVVFFVPKSLLGIEGQRKLEKFAIFTRKPRSHARILIYRTWAYSDWNPQSNLLKLFGVSSEMSSHPKKYFGFAFDQFIELVYTAKIDYGHYDLWDCRWVSWKQRPLRPQNLRTKTTPPPPPPYFGGLQNYGQPWKLSIGDKNFEATFYL